MMLAIGANALAFLAAQGPRRSIASDKEALAVKRAALSRANPRGYRRQIAARLLAASVTAILVAGCGGASPRVSVAASTTPWTLHRVRSAQLEIATPSIWTVKAAHGSNGVVFAAFDLRVGLLGVQVARLPPRLHGLTLAQFTRVFVAVLQKKPLVGTIRLAKTRLAGKAAEELRYVVARPRGAKTFVDEFILVGRGAWLVSYVAPSDKAAQYAQTFLRSANSLRFTG